MREKNMTKGLNIANLTISLDNIPLVQGLNLSLAPGKRLALVGESGSGKSLTAMAIAGLLPSSLRHQGVISFNGQNLDQPQDWQKIRGRQIGMIFQEPMSALNPLMTTRDQIAEGLYHHFKPTRGTAKKQAEDWLARVGMDPGLYAKRYPHQLSGGQRQRVMIAMVAALRPSLLIADEPTTALDVISRQDILQCLDQLAQKMALILISHEMTLAAKFCDQIAVMAHGRIVEVGPAKRLQEPPAHPQTRALWTSESKLYKADFKKLINKEKNKSLLSVNSLYASYKNSAFSPSVFSLADISFQLASGESLAIVGESGSGKSTLARIIAGLQVPTAGEILIDGENPRDAFNKAQMIFQDPYGSLDPKHTIKTIVAEPLRLLPQQPDPATRKQRVIAALEEVGLDENALDRYPAQFSGGQRQRIALARALIIRPALLIADEATSALDPTVQDRILDLLTALQARHNLTLLMITHNLAVAKRMATRLIVMKDGKIIEAGATEQVITSPQSFYTEQLIQASQINQESDGYPVVQSEKEFQ